MAKGLGISLSCAVKRKHHDLGILTRNRQSQQATVGSHKTVHSAVVTSGATEQETSLLQELIVNTRDENSSWH